MADTQPTLRLTLDGAQKLLAAAKDKAQSMGVPQCIAIVDAAGHLLAFARMDGAKYISRGSAERKAVTAAATAQPTGGVQPPEAAVQLAFATDGRRINLPGGLPIIIEGQVVGGIGIGSGKGEEDLEVAKAALAALPGAKRF